MSATNIISIRAEREAEIVHLFTHRVRGNHMEWYYDVYRSGGEIIVYKDGYIEKTFPGDTALDYVKGWIDCLEAAFGIAFDALVSLTEAHSVHSKAVPVWDMGRNGVRALGRRPEGCTD